MNGNISRKRIGTGFENYFKHAAHRQQVGVLKIPDGCKRINMGPGQVKLIPVKTPCDYIIAFNNKVALIDTKSHGKGKTFPTSLINQFQVNDMIQLHRHGIIAGYVCLFAEHDKIIFFNVEQLQDCQPGSSLGFEDGVDLGTVEEPNLKAIFDGTV